MNKQYTIRGIDRDLDRAVRETATRFDVSINKAAVSLMKKGAGLDATGQAKGPPYHDMDSLAGALPREEAARLLGTLKDQRKIDHELWRER